MLGPVSPLGWGVLVAAVLSGLAGWSLGWIEFTYAAAALVTLFALACLLTIGRTRLEVRLRVHPTRVRAGDAAAAEVQVRNLGRFPLPPIPLELPTGDSATVLLMPMLSRGGVHDELVILPTEKRGVYPIGPATTLRGDPFGLVRRAVAWTPTIELFVHPRTVYVDPFTSGVLRDLEGQTTNDVSASDLAFHGLREYVPGDDRRHIHWLSTAKRSSSGGQADLMVRQFLDTRRTHVGLVVDCNETAYAVATDFEAALEAGASIAQRAVGDKVDLTLGTGPFVLRSPKGHTAMDVLARARLGGERVDLVAGTLTRLSPSMSTVVIVTGAAADLTSVHRAIASFPPGMRVLVLRFDAGSEIRRQRSSGAMLITFGDLGDLNKALAGSRRP